jgi:carbon monoxide dehydrogenase subunit G
MRIENTVEVDAPLDRVWALVNDIPRVAPCMPGAALTGVHDDTYEGTVAVKLGPLRMSYKGKVVVEGVDEANHSARLAATGKDTKGAGTARASVETRLEAVDPTRTRLHVTSDVQLTGKVASFGRGGAINDVATRLFGQFADCLRATLESEQAPAGSTDAPSSPAPGAPSPVAPGVPSPAATGAPSPGPAESVASSEPVAAGDGTATAGDGAAAASATAAAETGSEARAAAPTAQPSPGTGQPAATTPGAAPGTPAPRAAEALDAGSLVGTVIKGRLTALFQAIAGFFRRLFGRRSTG